MAAYDLPNPHSFPRLSNFHSNNLSQPSDHPRMHVPESPIRQHHHPRLPTRLQSTHATTRPFTPGGIPMGRLRYSINRRALHHQFGLHGPLSWTFDLAAGDHGICLPDSGVLPTGVHGMDANRWVEKLACQCDGRCYGEWCCECYYRRGWEQ